MKRLVLGSLLAALLAAPAAAQAIDYAPVDTPGPVLSPARAVLTRVPLGPRPSLHQLRGRSPVVVRRLRRYSREV